MPRIITVTTGARLHFGPQAASGSAGGRFGGVGMMVSTPGYRLSAQVAAVDQCTGDEAARIRAGEFLRSIRQASSGGLEIPGIQLQIEQVIPPHSGLGSGTQLGLAICRLLSELTGEQNVTVETLAQRAGRGLRSAIGLHGFALGGFLVDGGRTGPGQLGTLVSRFEFPGSWRLLLVTPPKASGLSGDQEQQALASQPPMPQSLTAELCRIALMEWMPALVEVDFPRASEAMYDFGMGVGRFFEPLQGGVFASRLMADLAVVARQRGVRGVAQTSWGPTVCLQCDGAAMAQDLMRDLQSQDRFAACAFRIAEGLNSGARIERAAGDA